MEKKGPPLSLEICLCSLGLVMFLFSSVDSLVSLFSSIDFLTNSELTGIEDSLVSIFVLFDSTFGLRDPPRTEPEPN